VLAGNGPDALIAILSCCSLAACAPLNPATKNQELESLIAELGLEAVLTFAETDFGGLAKQVPVFKVELGDNRQLRLKNLNGLKLNKKIKKTSNIAIILHTSGTTAKPKIVPLGLASILASARNIISVLKLSEKDICLDLMPFFHVHGLMVAISTLLSGGTIICPPRFEPSQFYQWLEAFRPTWYTASPTIHQSILDLVGQNKKIIKKSRLRFIRSSSAAMPIKLLEKLEKVWRAPVAESYGMSEAALQITSMPLPPKLRKSGSAGKAYGLKIAIIDEAGKKLKAGETGEIIIRGRNIIKEYGSGAEVNRRSFWRGWLRTGDIGYLDKDGFLFIKGRIKEMINKGGEKISPKEIDEAIMKHPTVKLAVAFAMPHPSLGEDIGAAVILNKKNKLNEEQLKIFLRKNLSDFKVPSRIFIVDDIPKGPTGKIQRLGLYEKIKPLFAARKVLPKNNLEKEMIKVWQKILKIKKIAVGDNFFEIGGDSLKAIEAVLMIKKSNHDISYDDFLSHPTIFSLAQFIIDKKA
jgi:acyl-CoA synthetase (AMP-forming)/AMP-acid ligase II/aryl carrier-like protein